MRIFLLIRRVAVSVRLNRSYIDAYRKRGPYETRRVNNVGSKGSVFRGRCEGITSRAMSVSMRAEALVQLLVLEVVDLLFQGAFVEQVSEAD